MADEAEGVLITEGPVVAGGVLVAEDPECGAVAER